MTKIATTLKALMDHRQVSQYELAAKTGVPQPTIQRILAKKSKDPRTQTLEAIAGFFGLTAEEMRAGAKRAFGAVGNISEPVLYPPVPVISWVRAGNMRDIDQIPDPSVGDWPTARPDSKIGPRSWALRVEGDSMDDGTQKGIPEGYLIFVDPDVAPFPNAYVIAKDVATQQATFKLLVTDAGRWYLKPLNKAYPMIEIDNPELRVIGVVVEARPPSRRLL